MTINNKIITVLLTLIHLSHFFAFVTRQYPQSYIAKLPLFSDNPESNINTFSKELPIEQNTGSTVTVSSEGDVIVDFDALALESAAEAFKPKIDISNMVVKTERKAPRQAKWFPMLLSPEPLDGSMAGDVGFDPIGFSKDKKSLNYMREAEIKHSRLAMLAAAGWPLSELWHKEIANVLGLESILADADKAPSVLNGGLTNGWIIGTGAFSLAVGAALEYFSMQAASKEGYKPGDLNFDPLRLYSIRSAFGIDIITEKITAEEKIIRAKKDMELSEIKHGRLAMLAITAFAAQEFISGIPVVQQTPFFFGDPIV